MGHDAFEQQVVDALPALVYRAAGDTEAWAFTSVQGGLLERLGLTAEELCDDPSRWLLMIHRADRERVIAERGRATRSGLVEVEYRLRTADGIDVWVHDVATGHGHDDGILGLVTDLTEHRHADDVLGQLYDGRLGAVASVLRAASVRDTTVQLFVHDIRSPLTAVAGLAQTLQERGTELPAVDRDRILGRIAVASDRIVTLVDDFAGVWGAPVGTVRTTDRVALVHIVRAAVAEVDVEDGAVDVDVGDVVLETHPELLRRVLVGLIRNAVQHNPRGTHIRVWALDEGDGVVVYVEDDGPGIPEELRDHMFEAPGRASPDGGGLGIGLTLVRAAIALLGGDVRLLAHPSGGTIMRVQVPSISNDGVQATHA